MKIKQKTKNNFYIVGVGASAGGLKAFTQFLEAIPPNINMAFVLVQHLDPTRKSLLSETLSRATSLPFTEITDGTKIKTNNIYVMPSESYVTIVDHTLHLIPRSKHSDSHRPINFFFESLAGYHGKHAVGIVLSGTGQDGTEGLSAIKTHGGITFAQDESAQYADMPQSAINAGSVDFILPPDVIPQTLLQISREIKNSPDTLQASLLETQNIDAVLTLLKAKTGMDFRQYKSTTVNRRIHRRMLFNQVKSLQDYVIFIGKNPQEIEALNKDMLIHVTSFFREPDQFEALNRLVFPALLQNRSSKEPIRIWVPGCATGEEAYSLAIAFKEFLGEKGPSLPIHILATDITEHVIAEASKGVYKENITENVSPEQITKFFTKVNDGYKVKKTIRDVCEFAVADVTQKPLQLNFDFISCRNTLIYLGSALQQKAFFMLSSALEPGGFLLLGKSEGLGTFTKLFSMVDGKQKIYSKNDVISVAPSLKKTVDSRTGMSTPLLFSEETPISPLENFDRTARQQKVIKLKEAIALTQEYANEIISELDIMNEEMQSTNEELVSSNEELQITNEELETTQEELQAGNEEMTTLNEELQTRNDETSTALDYAEAIIKTVREPLVVLDDSFRVKSANESFCKIFKVTPQQTENVSLFELGNKQWEIPQLRRLLEKILPKDMIVADYEVEHDFESIGPKIMLLSARTLKQGPKETPLILLAIEDITDRKNIEKQKDLFMSIASHELKTPLTTIKGYTDILAKQFKRDEQIEYLPYISKMDYQVTRMTMLINDLFDVSRVQTGKLELRKENLEIDNLVKDIVEDMQQIYTTHRVIFEGKTNGEIAYVDKYRLSQVLVNLISNAVKYSPENKKVIIQTVIKENYIIVSVQDFGIGISKKDQTKIFERFFQARTNIRESAFGLGLGLYISKEIIDRHLGKIWLKSVKGQGTTFFFKLPMKENKNHA